MLENTVLVGIGYKARQGKDTAAQGMLEARPDKVRVYGFADAVKAVCRHSQNMTEKDPALLQEYAALERAEDPHSWIDQLMWRIDEDRPTIAVIKDLRYQNEAEWIRENGGILCKVTRISKETGEQVLATDRPLDHPSETELDSWSDWDVHWREIYAGRLKRLAGDFIDDYLTSERFRSMLQQLEEPVCP